jgi:mannose-1-phosphate guanylyltransferase
LLICNEDHRFIVAEQMRQIGVEPAAILLEPMGRATAPAVAVAALQATARGEDPLLLVLAAEHVSEDARGFRAAVEAGMPAAEAGYGYIEAAQPLTNSDPAHPAGLSPVPIASCVRSRVISDARTSCYHG